MAIEYVKHLRGDEGIRSIVDGQGDFISGRSRRGQPCPVRTQPVAARPQADGSDQQVIGNHGAQRPVPLRRGHDEGSRSQQMQRERCANQDGGLPARIRHGVAGQKLRHKSAPR